MDISSFRGKMLQVFSLSVYLCIYDYLHGHETCDKSFMDEICTAVALLVSLLSLLSCECLLLFLFSFLLFLECYYCCGGANNNNRFHLVLLIER